MKARTPFFKQFHRVLFGRPRRSERQQRERQLQALQEAGLSELSEALQPCLPPELLRPPKHGPNSRSRHFSLPVTFWALFSQVLTPGTSCREAVRKVQAWCAKKRIPRPDSRTGSYCKARKRLPLQTLTEVHQHTANELTRRAPTSELWCGHHVKIVDGSGVSMPDTAANQQAFPQSSQQKPGCGFPTARVVALFSLATGALLRWVEGTLHDSEVTLWRLLWPCFSPGDVALGDRAFSGYADMAGLYIRGVHSVMRMHQSRKPDMNKSKVLGPGDRLQTWTRPRSRPKNFSLEEWSRLPEKLVVRLVEISIIPPGFRPKQLTVVTTLTDPYRYPPQELARLYMRRWSIELYLRDIKITLGMDVLRCKTPEMVRKEVCMHAIVHNAIRLLMQKAATDWGVPLDRISFKGALDTFRQWGPILAAAQGKPRKMASALHELLELLAEDLVPRRPNRTEPRVVKRRPKNYRRMTRPRHDEPEPHEVPIPVPQTVLAGA